MQVDVSCLSCLVKQLSATLKLIDIEDSEAKKYAKEILGLLSETDLDVPPPLVAKKIYRTLSELTGVNDPYEKVKYESNKLAMKIVGDLQKVINSEPESERFEIAVKIVIAGNIIDYGVNADINDEMIIDEIRNVNSQKLGAESVKSFYNNIQQSENIYYIGDNAGEIVIDKYFIDNYLADKNVKYAVRGAPIINDSTLKDAEMVRMHESAEVVSTGDDSPGIDFDAASDEFFDCFSNADMVILKGQGNYETAYRSDLKNIISEKINKNFDKPIYFLFKVKCPLVAGISGFPLGSLMLLEL